VTATVTASATVTATATATTGNRKRIPNDGIQTGRRRCRRRGQIRAHHPANPEPFRGRVRSHNRGLLPKASGYR